ncbi:MAG: hypothetical protein H7236_18835 [Gemmatimonadaceae bacterium]|uniref:hypothetical protein n=1 Tax=Caulobacter sp. DWP3-1-3b2 TaxID=2804643 RepID=UPI0019CB672E|nr:hypothetical protein [Caulobacter sp.]
MSDSKTPADRATARPWPTPRTLRDLHLYLAVFFAPSILFFALTGALQLFGLHEAHGADYRPPSVIAKLSEVHIHQHYALKPGRPNAEPAAKPPEGAGPAAAASSAAPKAEAKEPSTLAVQIFFLGTALGLTLAALLGLWIGLTQGRLRKVSAVLAVLGTVLPILLLAVQ